MLHKASPTQSVSYLGVRSRDILIMKKIIRISVIMYSYMCFTFSNETLIILRAHVIFTMSCHVTYDILIMLQWCKFWLRRFTNRMARIGANVMCT